MHPVLKILLYVPLFLASLRKGYQRSCILLTVTPQHSRVRSRRESNNGIHARGLGEVEWRKKYFACILCDWMTHIHGMTEWRTSHMRHANGKLIFIRLTFVFPCWHGLDGSHKLGLSTHVLCRFALQAKQVQVLIDTFTSSFTTSAFTLYTYFIEISTWRRHTVFKISYCKLQIGPFYKIAEMKHFISNGLATAMASKVLKLWWGFTGKFPSINLSSNLRWRYPPWTSKGSPTFVKNLF